MLPIAPHDRRRRLEPNADAAALVDIGAFRGDVPDDILGGQYRCHRSSLHAMHLWVLNVCRPQACDLAHVIPEIDIWRAATLMLKRYGDKALEQSITRVNELAADGDHAGAVTWRRITTAVEQLANTTPPGPPH